MHPNYIYCILILPMMRTNHMFSNYLPMEYYCVFNKPIQYQTIN